MVEEVSIHSLHLRREKLVPEDIYQQGFEIVSIHSLHLRREKLSCTSRSRIKK